MPFEYLRIKNFSGSNYVEMLSIGYKKQMFVRDYPGLKTDKIIEIQPSGCDCPKVEYIERDYFNQLETEYNELQRRN